MILGIFCNCRRHTSLSRLAEEKCPRLGSFYSDVISLAFCDTKHEWRRQISFQIRRQRSLDLERSWKTIEPVDNGALSCFSCSLHEVSLEYLVPGAQGKSNMAGYGKQILVRDAFLWFMSAIYLFAFSSFYIQIPGKSFYLWLLMSIFFS